MSSILKQVSSNVKRNNKVTNSVQVACYCVRMNVIFLA